MTSLFGRVEAAIARRLFRLPHRVQVLLSGVPAIRIDGQTLHPEFQLMLGARRFRGATTLRAETAAIARERMRNEATRYRRGETRVRLVEELTIEGGAGPIAARHYVPLQVGGPPPILVYFHGGGFVAGDLDTHDEVCRILCATAGIHVLAVDYRLAPENPFPAAVDDGLSAFRWACREASRLGADPRRIAVGGDSAGGNLAAVVAQLARGDGGPAPVMQLLVYPAADRVATWPSASLFKTGFLLEGPDMDWYDASYVGKATEVRADPRVSPLRAANLSGLCPALVVTAGFDPLRDEGEAYAAALEASGNRVTLKRLEGFIHGFVNMTEVSPAAKAAVEEIARGVGALSRASLDAVVTSG